MAFKLKTFAAVGALIGSLALVDMRMPGKGGLTWLEEGNWPWPLLPVIVMTGHGTVDRKSVV